MGRLRAIAALLAIFSAISAVALAQQGHPAIAIVLIAGAAALAIVAPFPARHPSRRLVVAIVCAGHAVTATAAFLWASAVGLERGFVLTVASQAVIAAGLAAQAFRTRNWRRRPAGLRAYYVE